MKTFVLLKEGIQINITTAANIDEALDQFFRGIEVDVDLETYSEESLTVRRLRQRKSLPSYSIIEQKKRCAPWPP